MFSLIYFLCNCLLFASSSNKKFLSEVDAAINDKNKKNEVEQTRIIRYRN